MRVADEDGQVLAGRYVMGKRLGSGGAASVFLAEDRVLGRPVAVKWLRPGTENADSAARRFRREARITATLNHPNTVWLYDAVVEGADLFLVMEYVPGPTLAERMRDSSLPADELLTILRDVGDALDHAHELGVVHRDVKPANILLDSRNGQAKLADLGIASTVHSTRMTTTGAALGTPAYMAPELFDGRAATGAADVYSLAAIAFEGLSGQPLREGDTPIAMAFQAVTTPPKHLREVDPAVPGAAADAVARALARDPAQRPASCRDLIDAVAAAYQAPSAADGVPGPAAGAEHPQPPGPAVGVAEPAEPLAPAAGAAESGEPPAGAAAGAAAAGAAAAGAAAAGAAAASAAESGEPPTPADPAERAIAGAGAPKPGEPTVSWPPSGQSRRRIALLAACGAVVLAAAIAVPFALSGSHPAAPRTAPTRHAAAPPKATGPAATKGAGARSPSARRTHTPAPPAQAASGPATSPVAAVEQFYLRAARHDYPGAWALAAPSYRQQLQGYDSFRATFANVLAIHFEEIKVISSDGSTATIAVRSVSQQTSQTQHCAGTVTTQTASGGNWLVSQIGIQC